MIQNPNIDWKQSNKNSSVNSQWGREKKMTWDAQKILYSQNNPREENTAWEIPTLDFL